MTNERRRCVDELYLTALERLPELRPDFLAVTCAGDDEVLREVEELLRCDAAGSGFLERSALEEAVRQLAADAGPSLSGRQLGGYEIKHPIGAGGMGEVYRAVDVRLERDAAVKVIAPLLVDDPGYLHRFEEEARLASALNHPNIVTIYGFGEETGLAFLAMELVSGRTLRAICSEGALPLARVLAVAVQLADALAAAHAGGVVHRDLKPENVMVTDASLVKILDFGIAKRDFPLHGEDRGARVIGEQAGADAGMILGSASYMSPEQASGLPAGPASDQFALGAILYELACGKRAFAKEDVAATLAAVRQSEPDPLRGINPDVPDALRRSIERCLAKDPAARHRDTNDLAEELHRIDDLMKRRGGMSRRRAIQLAGAGVAAVLASALVARRMSRPAPIRALAVLPFDNATRDEADDYLANGLSETLIRRMSGIATLRVVPRTAVFSLKASDLDRQAAGRALMADVVLTGTLVRTAGSLRVDVALFDVATAAQAWSHRYEHATSDMLALQNEIVAALVGDAFKLRLTDDERRRLSTGLTSDPEAFDLYLQARALHVRDTEADYLRARDLLREALERDANFAIAHAAMAATFSVMAVDGMERPTDAWPEASRHVRLALDLAPDLPEAHTEAASRAFFFDWDWRAAEREWLSALGSSAGQADPDFLLGYSLERWAMGRTDEALDIARKARARDPLSVIFKVREADLLLHAGRFDEAAGLYARIIRDDPDDTRAYFGLADTRGAQGRFDEAIALLLKAQAAAGGPVAGGDASGAGEAGWRAVNTAWARAQLDDLTDRSKLAYTSPLDVARVHARLGHVDETFGLIDRAFEDRAPGLVFLNVDPAWSTIRHDSRFSAAVRRVGLEGAV